MTSTSRDVARAAGVSQVTALVAFNDVVACGVLRRLAARRLRVPDDLSVVGCDNTWLAQLTAPALTTIEVPRHRAGRAAVGQLGDRLRDPDTEPEEVVLATSLVIRDSTAPPGLQA
ncbi:MAG: substrate-binding domain-containing protein [Actinomycetia bacterium]|nr:substrate-binding domain-containing protein [Actinomycetes bacterium]